MYQTPPEYQAPPRKKSKTTLIVVIVILCLLPCLCLIGFGGYGYFFYTKNMQPMVGCVMTMTTAREAINRYANEEGKLPDADKWQDQVQKYYAELQKNGPQMGAKKPEEVWSCSGPEGEADTGIAFNSDLSGKAVKDVKDRSLTVVLFEVGKPLKNAHQPYKEQPFDKSPKMIGQPRGWFYITLQGKAQNTKPGSGINMPTGTGGD